MMKKYACVKLTDDVLRFLGSKDPRDLALKAGLPPDIKDRVDGVILTVKRVIDPSTQWPDGGVEVLAGDDSLVFRLSDVSLMDL